jgi:hypothetical protein
MMLASGLPTLIQAVPAGAFRPQSVHRLFVIKRPRQAAVLQTAAVERPEKVFPEMVQ